MARLGSALLFGIDFGTTFSGVAWSSSARHELNQVITNWDGYEGQKNSRKVPTQILYQASQIKWGFNIPPGETPLRWFKLLLLKDEDLEKHMGNGASSLSYIREGRVMLGKLRKTAEQVVADYLGLLWKHTLKAVKRELGEAAVEGLPFRVVLTFPAIWPVYAQSRMRQAAETAGILDHRHAGETILDLCPEPEAAALAVMDDNNGRPVESGDSFVVCDVGGGTADLITYMLESRQTWKLSECAMGAGKLCGAVFVDEAFENKMRDWVEKKNWNKFNGAEHTIWKQDHWERGLKRSFNGSDPEVGLTVPPQLITIQGINFRSMNPFSRRSKKTKPQVRGHQLRLPRDQVAAIFDVAIDQIVALVVDQIKKTRDNPRRRTSPTAVLLVGGFGQSPYLYNRIMAEAGIEVRISSEEKAWTAVCRGAMMRAAYLNSQDDNNIMPARIVSRVTRASYGIAIMVDYNPRIHRPEDKRYVNAVGKEMAVNVMQWYIHANQDIGDEPVRMDWSRRTKRPFDRNRFEVTLLRCDLEDPPPVKDETVVTEGDIVCQLNVPFDDLPSVTNLNGETWKDVQFIVEMRPCGTMIEFAVIYNGHRQKALKVNPPFAPEESRVESRAETRPGPRPRSRLEIGPPLPRSLRPPTPDPSPFESSEDGY